MSSNFKTFLYFPRKIRNITQALMFRITLYTYIHVYTYRYIKYVMLLFYLIVHVISVSHMITGAGTSLNMPPHVEFNFLAADTSASGHHRIPHAITAGAIHPWVSLIQVTPSRVIVPESTGTPGIRGISHARLWTFLVSQSGLGSMEGRGRILKQDRSVKPLLT